MKREFTGKYEQGTRKKGPIYVGDLVTLGVPRKEYLPDLIVFKVVKDEKGYSLLYYSGAMTEGDPNYRQDLGSQIYRVIGNIEEGIKEDLLK